MYDDIPDYRALAKTAQDLGYTTREMVAKRLLRKIMRDEAYLKRREARGTHTSHDDTTVEDDFVTGLAVAMLLHPDEY
jgi:hypothetical protein